MAVGKAVQTKRLHYGIRQFRVGCSQQNFFPHAVTEQLVVHILHDQKAFVQAGPCVGRLALPQDLPAQRLHQAAESFGQGAFTNAVMPHQAHDLPGGEAHIWKRPDEAAPVVTKGQVLHFQYRHPSALHRHFLLQSFPTRSQVPGAQTCVLQGRFRQGGKVRSRPNGCQLPRIKKEVAVHHILHPGQPVFGQHNGHAHLLHCGDHIVQLPDGPGIQIAGGFVQHQQLRTKHTGRCKGHPLLFAAGELEHTAIHESFQMELCHHFLYSLTDGCGRHPAVFTGEGQFCCGVHIEILRFGVLKHAAHQWYILLNGCAPCQQTAHRAAAGQFSGIKHRGKAIQQAGKGRFTAAASTTEQHALTGPDPQ